MPGSGSQTTTGEPLVYSINLIDEVLNELNYVGLNGSFGKSSRPDLRPFRPGGYVVPIHSNN